MDIFSILTFIGGLALFLFGMQFMGEGLEKRAGGGMRHTLEKLTSSPIRGVLLGAGVTAIIQSSSATTVMVVGFVNSGIMQLRQAIGIIMGANIGTTITAWLLSLTGLEGSSLVVQLLKPTSFTPILAVIGIVLYMFTKRDKKRDLGGILLGFAVLIFGMETMAGAVKPLANVPEFTNILLLFSNPILGVLAGALLTAVIQSSSASVGILQALSVTGSVTYASAIPIIMGQNIGTCITALLSSVGTSKNARRAALVHLYFNIIGTVVFLGLFYLCKSIFGFAFIVNAVDPAGIAIVHTIFNLCCTALLLPFTKLLERLACLTIKDSPEEVQPIFIDPRFLATPAIAVQRCRQLTEEMGAVCRTALENSVSLTTNYDTRLAQDVRAAEDRLDEFEDKIGSYLVELSSRSLSMVDSYQVSELLHTIGDFERIGDHALNILEAAEELKEKNLAFSDEAQQQLDVIAGAVSEILGLAVSSFKMDDYQLAAKVEPLEQVVDYLRTQLKFGHIKRLQSGGCTIELGFIFSDLLTNYERVADHCSNVAGCVIQTHLNSMNMHEYLAGVKLPENNEFQRLYEQYMEKYSL